MARRLGGIIQVKVDGNSLQAKGNFSYNVNPVKNESIVGSDGFHGYKSMPQAQFIEGAITDSEDLNLANLQASANATVILSLANGKTIVLRNAFYAADGDVSTEEGEIQFRFEGESGEEFTA